jgi:hypothetical protein
LSGPKSNISPTEELDLMKQRGHFAGAATGISTVRKGLFRIQKKRDALLVLERKYFTETRTKRIFYQNGKSKENFPGT